MSALRLLQLSDIHFSTVVDHERVEHDDVRRMLLSDARDELAARYGPVHGIVVAGDVAFSGQQSEYRQAAEWLERLASDVGCPATAIYTVPGNHDVNLERMTSITKQIHRYYRGLPLRQLRQEITRLAAGPTEDFLVEKLRDYHDFASSYGCDFLSPSRPLWSRRLPLDSSRKLRLLGLTSVQVSDLEDVKNGLILGSNQYIIEEEDCVEQIVIMHHPFEWLKDQQDAESYINNRARIVIMGHEHLARVQMITNAAGCDRLVIESGAVTPPDAHALYIYHYNLLSISLSEHNGEDCLHVHVYPRVWSPQGTRFVADTPRLSGREVAEFILRCPQYKKRSCAENATVRAEPAPTEAASTSGSTMNTPDDKDFAQLRYLFWRYLDWSQRMQVLVGVNALPSPLTNPVPQVVERLALERAREQGRLADLWERVMPFVPEDKRAPSPFRTST